jgi:large repetitive protein
MTLLAAAAAGAFAFTGGHALAAPVACGDKISADTKLDNDLVNCPNNGILIGADNISLDLNGHTIDGDNELIDPCPKNRICDNGVLARGHAGVTVKGGTVKQFGTGVFILSVDHSLVSGLTASRNIFNGILVGNSRRSGVQGSTASDNGLTTDYPGIAVFGSNHILISRTTSTRNADLGLFMVGSDNNRFIGNRFSDNPEAGAIMEGNGNEIVGNRVARNGDGLILSGSRNTIARNQILRSHGCRPGCGVGISLEGGHDNLIARNQVRAAREIGIRLVGKHFRDTVVRRNSVRDAGSTGVFVDSNLKRTLLERNHVRRAGADGIHVDSPATTLTRNHAHRNGGLGIDAVSGVIDAGGNVAGGNGNPEQCKNVACS